MKNDFPFRGRKPRRTNGVQPKAPVIRLDQPGRLRIENLLAIYGVKKTTFYDRQKRGLIPPPDGNDGRPYWFTQTICPFVQPPELKFL